MIQSGEGFLGRLLSSLLQKGLPLMKNVLIPLGLTAEASVADAAIHKRSYDLVKVPWTWLCQIIQQH